MRKATIERKTKETQIKVELNIDGKGTSKINTQIGFLDHMLELFAKHGLFNLKVDAKGDLQVDQHHTIEDIGIVLGQTFGKALADKKGINRTGFFAFPMDETLSIFAVDIAGRPYLNFEAEFKKEKINNLESDCISEFFQGFANELKANIHVKSFEARTDHHKAESIFKAFGKAMKMACSKDKRALDDIPSTKGKI
ncbi:MAG: imidazoleglycerol-phosphate dehydratase HisB [Candidatus Woesearchaeota archaeon]|jgi:imidazoleglycerol-phosphate dehydratase|nr:imidazoleglycerol-phosphate dehydratase HisB [Candidatus Woesearchaeota archaeon]